MFVLQKIYLQRDNDKSNMNNVRKKERKKERKEEREKERKILAV